MSKDRFLLRFEFAKFNSKSKQPRLKLRSQNQMASNANQRSQVTIAKIPTNFESMCSVILKSQREQQLQFAICVCDTGNGS
ncbi:unnamed protein product [Camellia sinensis]